MNLKELTNLRNHNLYVTDVDIHKWGQSITIECIVSVEGPFHIGDAYTVTLTDCSKIIFEYWAHYTPEETAGMIATNEEVADVVAADEGVNLTEDSGDRKSLSITSNSFALLVTYSGSAKVVSN